MQGKGNKFNGHARTHTRAPTHPIGRGTLTAHAIPTHCPPLPTLARAVQGPVGVGERPIARGSGHVRGRGLTRIESNRRDGLGVSAGVRGRGWRAVPHALVWGGVVYVRGGRARGAPPSALWPRVPVSCSFVCVRLLTRPPARAALQPTLQV